MNDKQPTDPQLHRLYREHATQEPSSAADRRILDAARRACEPTRSRRTWLRWKIPLSVAATVLLAFSIVSQLDMKNTPTIKDQVASSEPAAKAQIAPPANACPTSNAAPTAATAGSRSNAPAPASRPSPPG